MSRPSRGEFNVARQMRLMDRGLRCFLDARGTIAASMHTVACKAIECISTHRSDR